MHCAVQCICYMWRVICWLRTTNFLALPMGTKRMPTLWIQNGNSQIKNKSMEKQNKKLCNKSSNMFYLFQSDGIEGHFVDDYTVFIIHIYSILTTTPFMAIFVFFLFVNWFRIDYKCSERQIDLLPKWNGFILFIQLNLCAFHFIRIHSKFQFQLKPWQNALFTHSWIAINLFIYADYWAERFTVINIYKQQFLPAFLLSRRRVLWKIR